MLIEKPSSGKQRERADDGDGHGQQRNQRGAPVLQEDEHHQITSTTAMNSVIDHVLDGGAHEPGRVVGNRVFNARRESLLRAPP